jgi:hypothetical protein
MEMPQVDKAKWVKLYNVPTGPLAAARFLDAYIGAALDAEFSFKVAYPGVDPLNIQVVADIDGVQVAFTPQAAIALAAGMENTLCQNGDAGNEFALSHGLPDVINGLRGMAQLAEEKLKMASAVH